MKQVKIVIALLFLISLSNKLIGQSTNKLTLTGHERVSILEERFYFITIISDSSIIIEAYKKSKGQITFFDLFNEVTDTYTPQLLHLNTIRIEKINENHYELKENYSIKLKNKQWVFCRNGKNINLNDLNENDENLRLFRNSSLLTYVFYFPNIFLEYPKTIMYEEQIKVNKIINESATLIAKQQMDYSSFKIYIKKKFIDELNK
jgi:hypothetical protein